MAIRVDENFIVLAMENKQTEQFPFVSDGAMNKLATGYVPENRRPAGPLPPSRIGGIHTMPSLLISSVQTIFWCSVKLVHWTSGLLDLLMKLCRCGDDAHYFPKTIQMLLAGLLQHNWSTAAEEPLTFCKRGIGVTPPHFLAELNNSLQSWTTGFPAY